MVAAAAAAALLTMSSQLGFSLKDYTFCTYTAGIFLARETFSRKNKIHFKTVAMEHFVISSR